MNISSPHKTTTSTYFCPKCASPSITVMSIDLSGTGGSPAECHACGWKGAARELSASQFQHEFASDDEVLNSMVRDLRNLLAKTAAKTYAAFLFKWGFIDQSTPALQLATYLEAIADSVVRTVIEVRKKFAEEKARGSGRTPGSA